MVEILNGKDSGKKMLSIRKLIIAMNLGQDVSQLFPHVIKNMETDNINLKKLTYMYITNYSKTNPELALMAINTFMKDCTDTANPLLRALAVRTLGYFRVKQVTEYLLQSI